MGAERVHTNFTNLHEPGEAPPNYEIRITQKENKETKRTEEDFNHGLHRFTDRKTEQVHTNFTNLHEWKKHHRIMKSESQKETKETKKTEEDFNHGLNRYHG